MAEGGHGGDSFDDASEVAVDAAFAAVWRRVEEVVDEARSAVEDKLHCFDMAVCGKSLRRTSTARCCLSRLEDNEGCAGGSDLAEDMENIRAEAGRLLSWRPGGELS